MNTAIKCAFATALALAPVGMLAQDAREAHTFYVCETGNNANDGLSPKTPKRNIEKAILASSDGDTILVAEGTYDGILGSGSIGVRRAVEIRGGYSRDFAVRDIRDHATVISPTSRPGMAQKTPVMTVEVKRGGTKTVIDGLVIDGGNMTAYCVPDSQVRRPDGVKTPRMAAHGTCGAGGPDLKVNGIITREQPLIFIGGGTADVTIRNCAFINAPSNAIMGVAAGRLTVENNIFVNCRLSAMAVRSAKPDGANAIEFSNNTTVFIWASAAGAQDAGCAITLLPGTSYNLRGNIFALCATAAIDLRESGDHLAGSIIINNVFADNAKGDIALEDRKSPFVNCSRMAALKWIKGGDGNETAQSLQIFGANIDHPYANGFLALTLDAAPKTMYANRYDRHAAMLLWGAVKGRGAQRP